MVALTINMSSKMKKVFILFAAALTLQSQAQTLHYDRPAQFFEEALVIGNGTMGGIVYGGTEVDRISLNDITLWTGEPCNMNVYSPNAHQSIPAIRAALRRGDYHEADRLQRDVQGHFSQNYQPLGQLVIEYLATTNKKTIVNLTHHAFFSLAGTADPTPTIEDQICEINADFYLPTDDTAIPTGEILKVEGTPFDFRTPKAFGKDINADHEQIKFGHGFDHNYVLNKKEEGELSFAARITEPKSGRTLECYTTEPGMQLYTANFATGYKGANGCTFPYRSAVCLETQHFPDSPNRPYFPSVVLNPGEQYKHKTIYRFGVVE